MGELRIRVGADSKQGTRRRNEDAWDFSADGEVLTVADGIGGGLHGDIASRVACSAAIDRVYASKGAQSAIDLEEVFKVANDAVVQVSSWLRCEMRMGTTLNLVYIDKNKGDIYVVWAGDTLTYLLHGDGYMERLTDPDRQSEFSHALTNDVGFESDATPNCVSADIRPGDRVLQCTDGVWEVLGEVELRDLLGADANAPWIANAITSTAVEKASIDADNATVIVAIVMEEEARSDVELSEDSAANVSSAICTPTLPEMDQGQKMQVGGSYEHVCSGKA